MMRGYINDFPNQLLEALEIGRSIEWKSGDVKVNNIVISGMGGSGIGGLLVKDLLIDQLPVPIFVNNSYNIPAFVGPQTLFIASSYSGNTEETLSAVKKALLTGAQVHCISSGGKLKEIALEKELNFIQLPSDYQSPRACLGFSFVQLLFIFKDFGWIDGAFELEIESAAELLKKNQNEIEKKAAQMANQLLEKDLYLYTQLGYESVAIRWRQQINENSKILCNHQLIPEMNHNEIVGWHDQMQNTVALLLRFDEELERNKARFSISADIIGNKVDEVLTINALGVSKMEQVLYSIHFGDWLSLLLAEKRNIDPISIDNINLLKGKLAELDA